MRFLAFQFAMLSLCLACSASVQASIMVPSLGGELSEEEVLSSLEESEAATSQASNRSPQPSPQEENLPTKLNPYIGMFASGDAGGMSGSSVSTSSGGNLAMAVSAKDDPLQDNTLVLWLSRSVWLAIPSPPGGSLLRPPQIV